MANSILASALVIKTRMNSNQSLGLQTSLASRRDLPYGKVLDKGTTQRCSTLMIQNEGIRSFTLSVSILVIMI